jgi:N-methylhydantoinase B
VLGNTDILTAEPGDIIRIYSPGGGGRGSPLDREPERVLQDVIRGYVSAVAAESEYGVVIRQGKVDAAATERRRAEMRPHEPNDHFHFGPEREAFEQVWTREAYDELGVLLAALPIHWRFFVKTKIFAEMAKEEGGRAGVRRAFARVAASYPQIRVAAS